MVHLAQTSADLEAVSCRQKQPDEVNPVPHSSADHCGTLPTLKAGLGCQNAQLPYVFSHFGEKKLLSSAI